MIRVPWITAAAFSATVVTLLHGPSRAEPSSTAPGRIHVQVYADDSLSELERLAIERAVARGAADATRSKVVRIADDAAAMREAARAPLERADADRALARESLRNLEIEAAATPLARAASTYERFLPELVGRDGDANALVEVYLQQSVAAVLSEDREAAAASLRRALVLRPTLDYDPALLPPQAEELVLQERLLFDELGRGAAEITASTPGTVFVNGVERGTTPARVDDLPAGPNIVHVRVPGAEPSTLTAQVEGKGHLAEVVAAVPERMSETTGPLADTREHVGSPAAHPLLHSAASDLGVDALLLVLPAVTDERLVLTGHLYDMRSGDLVSRTQAPAPRATPEDAAAALGRELIGGAAWRDRPDLTSVAAFDAASAMDGTADGPPIWEHRYFWPAVGAAAGVVVVGVIVAVVASDGLSPGQRVAVFPVIEF